MAKSQSKIGGREATKGVIPGKYSLSVGLPDRKPPFGWKWTKLTDLARLESGHTPSRRHPEYWGGQIPWLGIKDAGRHHGRVIFETNECATELGIENSAARLLPAGTVCLSRTASIGYITRLGQPMATSQDFVNWVCYDTLEPKFLMYILLSEVSSFRYFSHGSTHQTIYFPEVKAFHICAPTLKEQKRIAAVLGALDDKIENNRKMNETLEAMAQAIFKSWFVDFDPVIDNALRAGNPIPADLEHKAARRREVMARDDYKKQPYTHLFPDRFVDSDLGSIPAGWKATSLGQVIDILDSKRIPLSKRQRAERQGSFPYYGATSIMDYVDDYLFEGPHILLGEDGSVIDQNDNPIVQYVWGKFWVNNHAHVLLSIEPICLEFLYAFLKQVNVRPYITGAVQLKINQGNLKSIPFLNPLTDQHSLYEKMVVPMFAKLRANADQSKTLTSLRDTLLPKLISGEIRVPEIEGLVDEAL